MNKFEGVYISPKCWTCGCVLFTIVGVEEIDSQIIKIKLLSKPNYCSLRYGVTQPGYATVTLDSIEECKKLDSIADLIKYVVLND